MTLFSVIYRPVSQKRYLPQNSVPFSMDSSAGDAFSLVVLPDFRAQKPLVADFRSALFPMQPSPWFSLRIYVFYHVENGGIYLCFGQSHTA